MKERSYKTAIQCPASENILNITATQQQIKSNQELVVNCSAGGKIELSPKKGTDIQYEANCSKCGIRRVVYFAQGVFTQEYDSNSDQTQKEPIQEHVGKLSPDQQTTPSQANSTFRLVCIKAEEDVNLDLGKELNTSPDCPHPHIVCPHSEKKGNIVITPIEQRGQPTSMKKLECTHCGACSSTERL